MPFRKPKQKQELIEMFFIKFVTELVEKKYRIFVNELRNTLRRIIDE
jgi:hypothetical protein